MLRIWILWRAWDHGAMEGDHVGPISQTHGVSVFAIAVAFTVQETRRRGTFSTQSQRSVRTWCHGFVPTRPTITLSSTAI